MRFRHSEQIWTDFPELATGVLLATGITGDDEAAEHAQSAVSATTTSALIVAEAMHESGRSDIALLLATAAGELTAVWPGTVQAGTVQAGTVQAGTIQAGTVQAGTVQAGTIQTCLLSSDRPRFETGSAEPGRQPSPA